MMLWKLLSRIDRSRFQPLVIALSHGSDRMLARFEQIGVTCDLLGMQTRGAAIGRIGALPGTLRRQAPHIIQGWMYHGNLAASLGGILLRRRPPVLWNIRGTLIERAHDKRLTAFVIRAGGKLSFTADRIINNSMASAVEHERHFGYDAAKRVILPNGFDVDLFRPSQTAGTRLRHELGLASDTVLVGLMGRYHPMKDHANFLSAAADLAGRYPLHCVLAGDRVDANNAELVRAVTTLGLTPRVHLLGQHEDMPTLTAGLDVAVCASSSGEGFPNVIGEAMSCAVPCVATDVGDCAHVIGDTGRIVPRHDSQALAGAIEEFIAMPASLRQAVGQRARQRILDHFALDSVVHRYENLYQEVYDGAHASQA